MLTSHFDVVVVGGGFFGCCLAARLAEKSKRVLVLEREPRLLLRASYANQARLHRGYHYPRSYRTAVRSQQNFALFANEFRDSIVSDFRKLYCIAARNSKVGQRYFEDFCKRMGAHMRPAPAAVRKLFSPHLIREVYEVEEYAFDCDRLRDLLAARLADLEVDVRTSTPVKRVTPRREAVLIEYEGGEATASWLFNCTYSGLNYIDGIRRPPSADLKHEIAEIALIEPPDELRGLGITVMDGPFFSVMPFPARGLHSLTHVRYTPHLSWVDHQEPDKDPSAVLSSYAKQSSFPFMIRDAARYLPVLRRARHVESLFEIKTVLARTELDDSRPILFDRDAQCPRIISVLGGKIDNIYDIFDFVDENVELD